MTKIVVIEESGSFEFYHDVDDAVNDLEPIDVNKNIYTAYDSHGLKLNLHAHKYFNTSFFSRLFRPEIENIIICSDENPLDLSFDLVVKLRVYFAEFTDKFPFEGDLENAALSDLVLHGLKYFSAKK